MAVFMLKRNLANEPVLLLRRRGAGMESLDPGGWNPTNNIEWTGIGGSADWEAVGDEEAAEAAVALGRRRSDVLGS